MAGPPASSLAPQPGLCQPPVVGPVVPRRTRALVAAIAVAGIVFVAGIWAAAYLLIGSEQRTALRNARVTVGNLSVAFQQELSGELDRVTTAMSLVAQRMIVDPNAEDLQTWARDLPLLSRPTFQGAIIGPDGHLRTTIQDPHPSPIDLNDRSYVQALRAKRTGELFVSEPMVGRLSGRMSINLARRVDAPDGRFLGIIVFSLAPGEFTQLHRAIDLGPGGTLAVLNADNEVLVRFGAGSPDGTVGIGQKLPPIPQRLQTDILHDVIHTAESRIDHVVRLYSDRRLTRYPLVVSVGLPVVQILAPVRTMARQIRITAAIVSLLLCTMLTALISEIRQRGRHEVLLARERSALAADIALRERVEQRLRESEQKFQDIAEVSGDWIWETDSEHRFTYLSPDAYPNATRMDPALVLGRTRWEVAANDPEQDENWRNHLADLHAHRTFRMLRYKAAFPDGQFRHFVVSGKPVFSQDGSFLGYRGTASNETAMVEAMQRAEQAETLLRDAIDHLSEGFVIFDSDDRLVICNEAYRRMYPASAHLMVPGVTFEALLRNTLASGHYPDAAGREEEWVADFLRIHREAVGELETQQRDGRWVLVSERRMRNGGLAGLRVDITEFKRIQAALQASEERLRQFAEQASDWFWETDAEGRFVWFSEGAERWNSRPYIGKTRREMAADGATPEQWEVLQADIAAQRPIRDFRYRLTDRNGNRRHVSINGMPQFDADGRMIGYRGVGRDITAQIEAAQELEQAKERAEQAETLLRDAVDSISEGLVIFDRDDRLVMCNEAYRRIYADIAEVIQPGVSFEELLRCTIRKGSNLEARGREEEWFAERLRQHREATGSVENHRSHRGRYLATDRRMKNGGIAGLRIDITALKQAQAALRESEERLDRAQAIAGIGSWELDVETGRYFWSKELYRMRGLDPANFTPDIDNVAIYVHPDDYPMVRRWLAQLMAGRPQNALEPRIVRPDGSIRTLRVEGRAVPDEDGRIQRIAGTMQDITERRSIERQLAQAQKMEAIGSLTGGMAHDFNNMLGIIVGNLELLKRLIGEGDTAAELCNEALDGATRCAELVRRLLAFARRQSLRPEPTDVNALVGDIARLIGRVLGDDIVLNLQLAPTLASIMADQAQLEAALVNFATNARDAMPKGGRLDIITRNVVLDAGYAALHPDVIPGPYVEIEITDTGTGISPEIINRIFEPFFTTKAPGKGTGLGLSMAFGFVKQSGGHLSVYSEPGIGTTFRLHLPAAPDGRMESADQVALNPPAGGDEMILVVEDNSPLRHAAARQLIELGYHVIEADSAQGALAALAGGQAFDLLFTDLVMPGNMDGVDLAHRALALRPGLKILLTSGFPGVRGSEQGNLERPFPMLIKPYRRDELAHTIRKVLDGDDNAAVAAAKCRIRAVTGATISDAVGTGMNQGEGD